MSILYFSYVSTNIMIYFPVAAFQQCKIVKSVIELTFSKY